MSGEKGQSLIELVVSLAIAILVLSSLAFAIITSLRNAQFAKNQAQATKLAQESLEKIRSLRDRNGVVDSYYFNDLWSRPLSCAEGTCYYFFNQSGVLTEGNSVETIVPNFTRQIQIEDISAATSATQKQITAVVRWNDSAGVHESRLTTILRNITQ